MRRLAAALAIAALIFPAIAGARDFGRGGDGHDMRGGRSEATRGRDGGFEGERFHGRGEAAGPFMDDGPRGYARAPERSIEPRRNLAAGRVYERDDYRPRERDRPGYGAPIYRAEPPPPYVANWNRGQYLPPAYRGTVVQNYGYYHLRRPPSGYYWYRSGNDFVLAGLASGLIFEVISAEGY